MNDQALTADQRQFSQQARASQSGPDPARLLEISLQMLGENHEEGDSTEVIHARIALRDVAKAVKQIPDTAAQIEADKTATREARQVRVAQHVDQITKQHGAKIVAAYEGLVSGIEALDGRLRGSIQPSQQDVQFGPEVRKHFASMQTDAQRAKELQRLMNSGDTRSLKLLVSAPAYLTGLSTAQLDQAAASMYDPDQYARLQRLYDAAERMQAAVKALKKVRSRYWTDDIDRMVAAAQAAGI